jgi:carboxylate-amine ligase
MAKILHLFEGFGVEMEYMIVDSTTLNVKPLADELIKLVEGEIVSETDQGKLSWCNELVTHVIEVKTNGPSSTLNGLTEHFQQNVRRINDLLEPLHAKLMPGAMHPWMDPFKETKLWEHEYNAIYESFNRIFDCRGHGWANLQSTHLNLPFNGDEEFGKLHAAIRVVLPLLPALSASSPIMDGRLTGTLDNRLSVYRTNARFVPSVSGKVIPEPYYTEKDYREKLLQRIYDDIAAHDPECILQDEWLNARGAIARFDRNAIEIRVLDIQEHPGVDIAILKLIVATIKALTQNNWLDLEHIKKFEVNDLNEILLETTRVGGDAIVNGEYTRIFGVETAPISVNELWRSILNELKFKTFSGDQKGLSIVELILTEGNLSQRITRSLGKNPTQADIFSVYKKLCSCLDEGKMFG